MSIVTRPKLKAVTVTNPGLELDVLPLFDRSNWESVRFGDVVDLVSETSRNPEAEGITRFIGMEHLEPGSLHIKTWGELVDGVTFTKRCRKGQVLFGKRRAYQRKVAIAEFDAVVSGDIYVFQAKEELLDPKLLPFLCMSERFFQFAVETSAGSLSPRTNWSHLAEFEFALPPLDQQRRIADLMWAYDDAATALDEVAIGVMSAEASLVRSLTDEEAWAKWDAEQILECVDVVSGQVDPRKEPYHSMVLVAPNHIEQGTGRLLLTESAKEQAAISGKYLFAPGDVVYSKIRPNLRKAVIVDFEGLCSADMYALRPRIGKLEARYLLAILLGEHFTAFAQERCVRTGIPKINRTELAEYSLPVPPIEEQRSICDQLNRIDAAAEASRIHRRNLSGVQTSILNSLFKAKA
jgi:type I restriction enzyme S subunit